MVHPPCSNNIILISVPGWPRARYESCTLKHLAREKMVNAGVNFVKSSDQEDLNGFCVTITMGGDT
jgi:hypothetical protein